MKRTTIKETQELARAAVQLERTRHRSAYGPRYGDKEFWEAAEETLAGYIDARVFMFCEDLRAGKEDPK